MYKIQDCTQHSATNVVLKGTPAQAETSSLISACLFLFLYLKYSFPIYPWVGYGTGALVCIISTSVSIKSGRSQGQSWHPKCHLEATEVTCSWQEDDSIIVYCHVPHQTPAQWHGVSQKANVSPWGKSCTDKSKDLWRNSLLNGAEETHVGGYRLSPFLMGSPARLRSLYMWLILFPCIMMEYAFFAPLLFDLFDFPLILKASLWA